MGVYMKLMETADKAVERRQAAEARLQAAQAHFDEMMAKEREAQAAVTAAQSEIIGIYAVEYVKRGLPIPEPDQLIWGPGNDINEKRALFGLAPLEVIPEVGRVEAEDGMEMQKFNIPKKIRKARKEKALVADTDKQEETSTDTKEEDKRAQRQDEPADKPEIVKDTEPLEAEENKPQQDEESNVPMNKAYAESILEGLGVLPRTKPPTTAQTKPEKGTGELESEQDAPWLDEFSDTDTSGETENKTKDTTPTEETKNSDNEEERLEDNDFFDGFSQPTPDGENKDKQDDDAPWF